MTLKHDIHDVNLQSCTQNNQSQFSMDISTH